MSKISLPVRAIDAVVNMQNDPEGRKILTKMNSMKIMTIVLSQSKHKRCEKKSKNEMNASGKIFTVTSDVQ